jgi:hypothetical protein
VRKQFLDILGAYSITFKDFMILRKPDDLRDEDGDVI